MTSVVVSTSLYVISHGRQPRGRGGWGFHLGGDRDLERVFWSQGTYAEARRSAIAEADRRGFDLVEVAP